LTALASCLVKVDAIPQNGLFEGDDIMPELQRSPINFDFKMPGTNHAGEVTPGNAKLY
jgi:hypothetical protein